MNTQLGLVDWLGFFGSFALVVALIGGLFWILNAINGRRPGNRPERCLAVTEVLSLGPRQRLLLVRARVREILLGISMQQMTRLGSWPLPAAANPARTSAPETPAMPATLTGAALKRLLGSRQEGR